MDERKDEERGYGCTILEENREKHKIHLLTIIGEIEGHECASPNSKTTKYDHVIPELAKIEDSGSADGLLVLLNTSGGDVDAGLAIAEMIASMDIPVVSLVLGGSHSIGIPLAVCADYSFIVPTGTMMVHPVRTNGLVIGSAQSFQYFEMIQDRIVSFVTEHSKITQDRFLNLMHNTKMMTKDLGTILVGEDTVKEGLINEIGGISESLSKLHRMIDCE